MKRNPKWFVTLWERKENDFCNMVSSVYLIIQKRVRKAVLNCISTKRVTDKGFFWLVLGLRTSLLGIKVFPQDPAV